LVASAVSAAIGASFFYFAAVGDSARVASAVLWKLGCGLGFFALALQPGVLFEPVRRVGRSFEMPRVQGLAAVLNLLSVGCMALALLTWLLE
jgi:hypothetical protein